MGVGHRGSAAPQRKGVVATGSDLAIPAGAVIATRDLTAFYSRCLSTDTFRSCTPGNLRMSNKHPVRHVIANIATYRTLVSTTVTSGTSTVIIRRNCF